MVRCYETLYLKWIKWIRFFVQFKDGFYIGLVRIFVACRGWAFRIFWVSWSFWKFSSLFEHSLDCESWSESSSLGRVLKMFSENIGFAEELELLEESVLFFKYQLWFEVFWTLGKNRFLVLVVMFLDVLVLIKNRYELSVWGEMRSLMRWGFLLRGMHWKHVCTLQLSGRKCWTFCFLLFTWNKWKCVYFCFFTLIVYYILIGKRKGKGREVQRKKIKMRQFFLLIVYRIKKK